MSESSVTVEVMMMQTVQEFYERGLYSSDPEHAVQPSPTFLRTLRLFSPGNCDTFLDIGCGDGAHTAVIRDHIGARAVYGIDIGTGRLNAAAKRGIKVSVANLDQGVIGFKDQMFDCIHCGEVIEHVFSPDLLLENIYRLLKPGGYAILTTPNLASWRNRLALLLGWQPFWSEVSTKVVLGNPRSSGLPCGHLHLFTPRAMRDLTSLYRLRVEQMMGLSYLLKVEATDILSWVADRLDKVIPGIFPELGSVPRLP
jgi:methionine biosynthesis protein MetW